MAFEVPVICGHRRTRHAIILDGGRLLVPDHTATTAKLLWLLDSDVRCCTILRHYLHGLFQISRKPRVYIPSQIRSWTWILHGAVGPLYKSIDTVITAPFTTFLMFEEAPLGGRLAFGIPPDKPLLLWTSHADATTGAEWELATNWADTLGPHPDITYTGPEGRRYTLGVGMPDDHLAHLTRAVQQTIRAAAPQAVKLNTISPLPMPSTEQPRERRTQDDYARL